MVAERFKWLDDAACAGSTQVFYDDIWPEEAASAKRGPLARARGICAGCPILAQCAELALADESGYAVAERYGFRGGMTPSERWKADGRPTGVPDDPTIEPTEVDECESVYP